MRKKSNPVVYFEIPVPDMDRAIHFYRTVFQCSFAKEIIDGNEMALFPFNTDNIDETLQLVAGNGGQILYPKTDNGIGLVAEFEDPEGNRIALSQISN